MRKAPAPGPAALRDLLESTWARWHVPAEVQNDPLRFPRRYAAVPDREAAAFVAAAFAFGRVAAFLPVLERLLERLGPSPAAALAALAALDGDAALRAAEGVGHRWVRPAHVAGLLRGLGAVFAADGTLRLPVERAWRDGRGVTAGLRDLADTVRAGAGDLDPGFLLPRPDATGPLKRLHLFLRWMVRDDGLDLGCWTAIPPAALVMPVDVHVHRIAMGLGLLPPRRSGPRLADALALTEALRALDPADPVRFDFALSHVGISGRCTGRPGPACPGCALAPACTLGGGRPRRRPPA